MKNKTLLDVTIMAYEMEKRREEILNTKAGAIIAADIAILAAVVEKNLISLRILEIVNDKLSNIETVDTIYMIISLIIIAFGVLDLYRAFQIGGYGAVDSNTLIKEIKDANGREQVEIIIGHINLIILTDRNKNEEKANHIKSGFRLSMLGMVLMLSGIVFVM